MIIIPSIDIKEGKCVRLTQGDFRQSTVYSSTPGAIAQQFSDRGAIRLHIVDLDGAKIGQLSQISTIKDIILNFKGLVQVGGGIRRKADIDTLLMLGADRIVIGTGAVQDIAQTLTWINEYGPSSIVLAFDFKMTENVPYIAVSGWQENTKLRLWDILDNYQNIEHILCTDIAKDGMQEGPNFTFYKTLRTSYPKIKVQASGGIRNLDDLKKLDDLGVSGAIVGKAIYENKISIEEAIICLG